MVTRNEAYQRARLASEKIREDAYRAADQLSADAVTVAAAKLRQARFSVEARAARDATYSAAGDARAAAYAEAEQRHYDRLAAIQRHFGQQITRRGDPDADHALAFVETVADPEGLYTPQPAEAPIGRVVETTGSSARFALIPTVALSPRSRLPTTDGRVAGHSRATPKPS